MQLWAWSLGNGILKCQYCGFEQPFAGTVNEVPFGFPHVCDRSRYAHLIPPHGLAMDGRSGKRDQQEKQDRSACVHRGHDIRRETCPTCNGTVKIKVFACDLHGECALYKLKTVKICATCEDFEHE